MKTNQYRFRWLFALCTLGVLIPMGLLIFEALKKAHSEEAHRHVFIADRIIDEMERQLTDFLAVEEQRPFAHYDFNMETRSRQSLSTRPRSPLSEAPPFPYVLGYFQVDPDGSIHSPQIPRDNQGLGDDWNPNQKTFDDVALVRSIVLQYWNEDFLQKDLASEEALPNSASMDFYDEVGRREKAKVDKFDRPARLDRKADAQKPGTTLSLKVQGKLAKQEEITAQINEPKKNKESPYEALSELNTALSESGERKQVQSKKSLYSSLSSDRQRVAAPEPIDEAKEKAKAQADSLGQAMDEDEAPLEQDGLTAVGSVQIRAYDLSPMIGRVVDEEYLLLYRTVLANQKGYRQGLIIHVPTLTKEIESTVVSDPLHDYISTLFSTTPPAEPLSDRSSDYIYRHRFAEPFQAINLELGVLSLPEGRSLKTIRTLGILVTIFGIGGLLALYRMISVTLAFAERRSNFAASVSHELKTPLTSIRMYGEMLRDGMVPSKEKQQEYYQTITAESERLSRLIRNVLEFSQLEKGTRDLNLMIGPVAPVLEDVVNVLRPYIANEGFLLHLEIESDLPPVRFERDGLEQVIFNLIDNAIKYTTDSEKREIALYCKKKGDHVVLSIRDHGPGVPLQNLSKIFDPFFRGGSELTRKTKGTGLGLALVKSLSEHMGASVSGSNLERGGFEVSISLPVAEPAT